jgi:hypothetical protein
VNRVCCHALCSVKIIGFKILFLTVQPMPECKTDYDCGSQEKCQDGTCILACKLISCGRNAQCQSDFHSAKCVCISGYRGDPYSACSKGMIFFFEA